jgi:hypothetical protein
MRLARIAAATIVRRAFGSEASVIAAVISRCCRIVRLPT